MATSSVAAAPIQASHGLSWRYFNQFVNQVGIDWRSLLAFRIGLGLILIWDALSRVGDVMAFYTAQGVLPRDLWLQEFGSRYPLCLNLASDDPWLAYLTLLTLATSGLGIMLGYRTRLSLVMAFVLIGSLHTRNPQVLSLGDSLLRMLLFWAIFLPWGWLAQWMPQTTRDPGSEDELSIPSSACSPAVGALFLQVAGMYFITALMKTGDAWHNGQALYFALRLEHMNYPWSQQLLAYPDLLQFLTHATMVLEYLAPLLLLGIPVPKVSRMVAIVLLASLHVGIISTIRIGIFPWVNLVALLPFLPAAFWMVVPKTCSRSGFLLVQSLGFQSVGRNDAVRGANQPLIQRRSTTFSSLIGHVIVLAFTVYVVWWNVGTLHTQWGLPSSWRTIGYVMRLDQRWGMYAPEPSDFDGWYVMVAKTADGREVDLFRGGAEVNWDKPNDIAGMFPNFRWRKFLMKLVSRGHPKALRASFAEYAVKEWNNTHSAAQQIERLDIYFFVERTLPENQSTLNRRLVHTYLAKPTPQESP
ncbi:MAG: HTTM domain-containing protein [Planctomycetaceae bacterium]|nr:HTTM domain-containing protein [Planctomycetaceae bacterium]